MAAIAPITVNDGKTPTAMAHTFTPVQSVPPLYKRNDVPGQAAIAQERLMIRVIAAKTLNGVTRVQGELVIPVSEVPAGGASTGYVAPPAIAHEMKAKFEFYFAARSDSAGRKDLRVMLMNLLANAQFVSAIDNLEMPY